MKTLTILLSATMIALGGAQLASAAPMPSSISSMPGQVNYQGLLQDPNSGTPYTNGLYDIEFRLYTQQTGGSPIWGGSYSTYVKDGYFNVMLGDSATALSSNAPKYGPTELWKAMWYTGSNAKLYLGVTPRQNYRHQTLSSATEIAPRQTLLCAPYAFRAERSTYADGSTGDFTIDGNLTVRGTVTANQSGITLNHIASTGTELTLGESKTSPSTTKVQGGTVYVNANNGLNVTPGGNATVTMNSGKSLQVNGGSVNVDSNTINLKGSGGDVSVYASGAELNGGSGASVKSLNDGRVFVNGSGIDVTSKGNLNLAAGNTIYGEGGLRWGYKQGSSVTYLPLIQSVKLTTPKISAARFLSLETSLSGVDASKYYWSVAGFNTNPATALRSCYILNPNSSDPCLIVDPSSSTTVEVELLGILKTVVAH